MLKKNVLFVLLCGGILFIPLLINASNHPGPRIPWMTEGPSGSGVDCPCGPNNCLDSYSLPWPAGGCPGCWNDFCYRENGICMECGNEQPGPCGLCWVISRVDEDCCDKY